MSIAFSIAVEVLQSKNKLLEIASGHWLVHWSRVIDKVKYCASIHWLHIEVMPCELPLHIWVRDSLIILHIVYLPHIWVIELLCYIVFSLSLLS